MAPRPSTWALPTPKAHRPTRVPKSPSARRPESSRYAGFSATHSQTYPITRGFWTRPSCRKSLSIDLPDKRDGELGEAGLTVARLMVRDSRHRAPVGAEGGGLAHARVRRVDQLNASR